MNEHEAQTWIKEKCGVSRETYEKLNLFVSFLKHEASQQNLISASTIDSIWDRHIVDSAQLLQLLPDNVSSPNWLDLGSGAGFPGIVIGILSKFNVTLVESRTRRSDYLQRAIALLKMEDRVTVAAMPVERLRDVQYSVISARAFAPLPRLFAVAARFSTDKTIWLLPKGRNAATEWTEVQGEWTGDFRIVPSVTDSESGILVGRLFGTGQPA